MRVSMIGLGKLGLPVSCAMVQKGHEIYGYDVDAAKTTQYRNGVSGLYEPDMDAVLTKCLESGLHIVDTVEEAVKPAEIVFIAVPTPSRADNTFDTSYVEASLNDIAPYIGLGQPYRVVSIISTVLPATCRSVFIPTLEKAVGCLPDEHYGFCYNAQFIAMGTVIADFIFPEFTLVGEYDRHSGDVLGAFYSSCVEAPILRMSLESAEACKMAYNCYVGSKLVIANAIMELCHNVPGANCDVVSNALQKAYRRIAGTSYMVGGMGDGGSCHGRDNLALSSLAQYVGLSADPFAYTQQARDQQSRGLAKLIAGYVEKSGLPVAILGLTFKPKTNLTDFSAPLLLIDHLKELNIETDRYDPIIGPYELPYKPYVYVLAMRHDVLKQFAFCPGSIVIDPWRMLNKPPDNCEYVPIGIGKDD